MASEQEDWGAADAEAPTSTDAERRAGELLRIASHDLRAPLIAIQIVVQRLERLRQQGRAEMHVAAALSRISEVVQRGLAQVDGILSADYLAPASPQGQAAEPIVDVEDVIKDAIALQREALERAKCAVTVMRTTGVARAEGRWNRHCLVRIFSNLLQNASRYAPASSIHVELARAEDRLRITFADHGPGLPPTSPLEARRSGDGAPSGQHGLGIWIVRRGVAELNGSINIESAAGRGLTFAIELPGLLP